MSNKTPFFVTVLAPGIGQKDGDVAAPILPIITTEPLPVGAIFVGLTDNNSYIAIAEQKEPKAKTLVKSQYDSTQNFNAALTLAVDVDTKGSILNATMTANDWTTPNVEPARLKVEVYGSPQVFPSSPIHTYFLSRKYDGNIRVYSRNTPVYEWYSGYDSWWYAPVNPGSYMLLKATVYQQWRDYPVFNWLNYIEFSYAYLMDRWPWTKGGMTYSYWDWPMYDVPGKYNRPWGRFENLALGGNSSGYDYNYPLNSLPFWPYNQGGNEVDSKLLVYPEGFIQI